MEPRGTLVDAQEIRVGDQVPGPVEGLRTRVVDIEYGIGHLGALRLRLADGRSPVMLPWVAVMRFRSPLAENLRRGKYQVGGGLK